MIACVAAGTGFAVVPHSVLGALQAADKVRQHALPERIAANCTHLVWRGEASLALEGLIALLRDDLADDELAVGVSDPVAVDAC
jgi:DNA-binding transcriptional LysR family regulator